MSNSDFLQELERKRLEQAESWRSVRACFHDYQASEPAARVQLLGELFERASPWLERGIRSTALRHFLLLPVEMLLGRLFAALVHREELPSQPTTFLMWIEGTILRDLSDPTSELGVCNGAPGEPPAEVQRRFHSLSFAERAMLYLSLMDEAETSRVAERTGMPAPSLRARLDGIWKQLGGRPSAHADRMREDQ